MQWILLQHQLPWQVTIGRYFYETKLNNFCAHKEINGEKSDSAQGDILFEDDDDDDDEHISGC